jgi:hypothetical protein
LEVGIGPAANDPGPKSRIGLHDHIGQILRHHQLGGAGLAIGAGLGSVTASVLEGVANAMLVSFGRAVGWIALQIFGYVGALRMAKGDFAHPLFKSQVMLHVIALALLVAVFMRAFS